VRLTFGYSFSTWRFHQRGLGIHGAHDVGWLANLTAGALMRSDPRIVEGTTPLGLLRDSYPLGSAKVLFVVDQDRFIGTIDVPRLHDALADPQSCARDVAAGGENFLLPRQNVRNALTLFNSAQVETLPVLATAADRHLLGYLTEAYALRRYNQELELRRSEMGMRDLFPISEPVQPPPKAGG